MLKRFSAALLLPLVLLLGSCSGGGDSSDPAPTSSSPTSKQPAPPYVLDQHQAQDALQALPTPAGWRTNGVCPGVKGCPPPEKTMRWSTSVRFDGAKLPGGNGFPAFVYAFVTQYQTAGRARTVLKQAHRVERHYDGRFSTPIKQTGGGRYVPGEQGRGTVDTVTKDGWSGFDRDATFTYSFPGKPRSGEVRMQRYFLVRGPYALTVYANRPARARTPDADQVLTTLLSGLTAG